ncbi:MAG: MFS transporter [Limnohabitans sp.]|nr:MFS transporter [Limnohabitans sp.]
MTSFERRSGFSLASIYALRMLGLFMVLPVFMLDARHYVGGNNTSDVGLAMGLYGLVQAALQIPFGVAADRWGRKRVIYLGLVLFAIGSLVGALATSVHGLAWARALQGGGAISAAVTALLADQTRDEVRTKGMALIGGSIALMFALSLVLGPILSGMGGLKTIFIVTIFLALSGLFIVRWWTPPEPELTQSNDRVAFSELVCLLSHKDLLRLDLGVFVLYAVQLATWVSLPALISQAGIEPSQQGWVYLPTVLMSFVVMGATLFPMERRGLLRPLFLGSIALVIFVQLGWFYLSLGSITVVSLSIFLFLFFCGFNILEASQPSLASRLAPVHARGAALGVYNTLQSLGIFAGAAVGGWVASNWGAQGVFLTCAVFLALWLVLTWPMVFVRQDTLQTVSTH